MKKSKKVITSLALAGVLALSAIAPSTMEAQCATKEIVAVKTIKPAKLTKGTPIAYETVDSKINYQGAPYTKTYNKEEYTYFEVGYRCTSGGFYAQIDSVYELNGVIHVATSVQGNFGGINICVMTYPYVIGRIAKTSKKIVFDNVSNSVGGSELVTI